MPVVRRLDPSEWQAYRDVRLSALRDSPNAFGSVLAHEQARPDREWAERLAATAESQTSVPLVADSGGKLVGLAWGRVDDASPDVAHIYQMWVSPESRGQGIGATLVATLIDWARNAGAVRLALRVSCGNDAAERIYARAGFRAVGDPEPLRPGSASRSQSMCLDL